MTDNKLIPQNILFACTHNMIRSPIAEALAKPILPTQTLIDSCGINAGSPDGFAISVMQEIGVDITHHAPKNFADLTGQNFDLIICFSQESYQVALDFAPNQTAQTELWPVYDNALTSEHREERLNAYRYVRDTIELKLQQRFNPQNQQKA